MPDNVLIIEDTRSFAQLIQTVLMNDHGIVCDIASSLSDAEVLIRRNPGSYFASIVDLHLPDAPRGEAADLIVSQKIPAVVFTSMENPTFREDLWDRGIADYANKGGQHSLGYISWIIYRLLKNAEVEVLVVDDSRVARKSMSRLLETQRFNVNIAENGDKALQILSENTNISLVIVDCYMEGINGFQLSSKIREHYGRERLEIIGVSSQGGQSLSAQFIKSGANDFLDKPFLPEEFLCRVNHAVDRVESYQKLQSLNHLKNELLSTAAHDIRGPVGAIKTAAHYILNRDVNAEKKQKLLEMIESSSASVIDLLNDLLDVSVIEDGSVKLNIENTDLGVLVDERVALYIAQADEKGIQFQLNTSSGLMADIDKIKVRQVIDNLLTNAIKYSPKSGNIRVDLDRREEALQLEVHDSGPGIAINERKDLFKRFKTLSTEVTGGEKSTGLGLAIVKNVVDAHGGRIQCTDSDLGGACFVLVMPLKQE